MVLPPSVTNWLSNHTSTVSGGASGLLGVAAEVTGLVPEGANKTLVIAVCVLGGALIGIIPRLMTTWLTHKAGERDFIGKEMRELILFTKQSAEDALQVAEDNERILDLATSVRHTIQESYQAANYYIDYLQDALKEKGVENLHKIERLDVNALLRQMDEEIKEIKAARRKRRMAESEG